MKKGAPIPGIHQDHREARPARFPPARGSDGDADRVQRPVEGRIGRVEQPPPGQRGHRRRDNPGHQQHAAPQRWLLAGMLCIRCARMKPIIALAITAVTAKSTDWKITSWKVSRPSRKHVVVEADELRHPLVQHRQLDGVEERVDHQPADDGEQRQRHQEGEGRSPPRQAAAACCRRGARCRRHCRSRDGRRHRPFHASLRQPPRPQHGSRGSGAPRQPMRLGRAAGPAAAQPRL